jgi:hypothetical protein
MGIAMKYREDNRKEQSIQPVRIIACGVFRPLLEQINLVERFPGLNAAYLPSNLHINPNELKNELLKEITASQKKNERIICLYGECFPDIDILCKEHGVVKIDGHHCYEIFLGRGKFLEIMDENGRTYFLEKDLVLNFEEYCVKPLELHDREMKKLFFKNYEQLVYVRQPSDPDLIPAVNNIAEFLGLSVIVRDADYLNFEKALINMIGSDCT